MYGLDWTVCMIMLRPESGSFTARVPTNRHIPAYLFRPALVVYNLLLLAKVPASQRHVIYSDITFQLLV